MYFRSRLFSSLPLSALVVVVLGFFSFLEVAAAQTTSTIEGTVTDKQGLAVAGAQVHAEGVSIVADRGVTTDSNGEYRFPALPAELRLLRVLGPFQVAERLSRLAGRPVPVRVPTPERPAAKAA